MIHERLPFEENSRTSPPAQKFLPASREITADLQAAVGVLIRLDAIVITQVGKVRAPSSSGARRVSQGGKRTLTHTR